MHPQRPVAPRLAVLLAVLLLATPADAQQVDFEKFQLPNGMTVILHPDPAQPVAVVNLWVRVGSKDEPPGRSGFAHLFEHLMFMGTERVPGSDFDNLMEAGGGSNNATTSTDRTNYFSSGPSHLLPTLLWLEADRLEDLGRMMTQEKLDLQRAVVRNERRQTSENTPYGGVELIVAPTLYPEGHPYHHTVIGSHEDLETATVSDVKQFFANYYVPSNSSLVVAGDFEPEQIRPLIEQLFGTLPAAPEPRHARAEPVQLDGVVRRTLLDRVHLPRISFVYHSPAFFAEGDAEMDLVAALLSDGVSSRLHRRLVHEARVAVEVDAYQASAELGSLFTIEITTTPDADLDTVEKLVDEEIGHLIAGIDPAALARKVNGIVRKALTRLQSIQSRANALNRYQYYMDDPGWFQHDLDRYRFATPEGVERWAKRVLTPGQRLIVRVLPEAPVRDATPRDQRPAELARHAYAPPEPAHFTLSNGVPVEVWERPGLPLMAMEVRLAGGAADRVHLSRAGLADLTAKMLSQGSGERDAIAFARAIEDLGASFEASAGRDSMRLSLSSLAEGFEAGLALVADALLAPRLTDADFERVRARHLEQLKQTADSPRAVARQVARRLLYGEGHPYGMPVAGTPDSVAALTVEQLREYHRKLLAGAGASIRVAGALPPARVRELLEARLGKAALGPLTDDRVEETRVMPQSDQLRVYIVHRPRAVQTVIRFAMPSITADDPRYPELALIDTIVGGSFTSRLNANLREQHGYTYGAASRLAPRQHTGMLIATSAVRADVTGEALAEFLKEFERLRAGDIDATEVRKARETLRTDTIDAFSDIDGIVDTASDLADQGLTLADITRALATQNKTTAERLNALAHAAIPVENGVLVLVGDRGRILEEIQDLGLPAAVEVNVHARPVD